MEFYFTNGILVEN